MPAPRVTPGGAAPEGDPIRLVLKHLRGRVPIALALGLALAAAGAIAPWLALKPVYTATALIRVAPTGRVILFEVEDNQPLSHYDSFVNTQQQLLTSRRIVGAAIESPELKATGWPAGSIGIQQLVEALTVTRAKGAEIINVSLSHEDPALAATALNAVLKAYAEIQIEGELLRSQEQEQLLENRLRTLTSQAGTQRNLAREAAFPVTPDAIVRMLQVRTDDLAQLRSTITQIRMQPEDPNAIPLDPNALPSVAIDELTDDQLAQLLARRDADFAALDELLNSSERELLVLSSRVGPRHFQYQQLSAQVTSLQAEIAQRVAAFRDELKQAEALAAAAEPTTGDGAEPAPAAAPLTLMQRLLAEEEETSEEIAALAQKNQNVQRFLDEAERLESEISETRDRLERLRFERQDQNFGRITIEEYAAAPGRPSTDRRIPLSAAGGLAGLGGGAALVVLFGMLRPALRYSHDTGDLKTSAPLLAAIPDLSAGDDLGKQAAAFSIHHLRHLIEAGTGAATTLALAITSPGPGDGKTQLSLGLASSFASAGKRVVAIDLDFVGRGLSRATETNDRPGLAEHFAAAAPTESLAISAGSHPFHILPAGQPEPDFPATLNTARVRAAIAALRERFDVIIIDTGPVLGSLEASAAVAAADATLVVVGRGQRAPLVQAALARIAAMGGRSLGLVFNRAASVDVNESVGSISLRSGMSGANNAARRRSKGSLYQAVNRHEASGSNSP